MSKIYKKLFILLCMLSYASCSSLPEPDQVEEKVQDPRNPTHLIKKSDSSGTLSMDVFQKSNKENPQVNAYLWKGALETLKSFAIETIDMKSGFIETDWTQLQTKKYKVSVIVSNDPIISKSLNVNIKSQEFINNQWNYIQTDEKYADIIAANIISKARKFKQE